MNIEQKLVSSVIGGLKALYGQDVPAAQVQLQKTKKEFEGHLTLVVFPFLRMSKKGPEQTAQEIGEYLQANEPSVAAFNVIKGFLNLTIASSAWIELLNGIHADKQYGIVAVTDNSPLVMIEYSSPNTNKPLHLGHVRTNLLGNALANIVAANGNKVVKTNIVNDRGIHICKSMLAWQKYGNGETPESSGKKGDHLIGDYYVSFDKHYKAEVKELMAKFQSEGMNEEEAKAKAEAESPLMKEAREMPVTMCRLNLVKGQGPVLQIAEGWTVNLDKDVFKAINERTDRTWPSTFFAPRLTGKGYFRDVYTVMNNWGANHGAISYGHIGADLITLASMLRIPVCMHNVSEENIFRPSAWTAFGEDMEGSDYRACKNYGPLYK